MRSCRPALGTYVEVRVEHHDPDFVRSGALRTAIDDAFQAIQTVQTLMSAHCNDSELAQINCRAHLEPVSVHPWTYDILEQALEIHRISAGAFDCCIGHHLRAWGLLPQISENIATNSRMADMQLNARTVQSRQKLSLDLSGIAKGFAVDRAAEALRNAGVTEAVINAGGDLLVMGSHQEPIYVRHSNDPQQLKLAGHLRDGAFATSACYFSQTQLNEDCTVSALVNPLNNAPILGARSFSVIAPTCTIADALTKVLAVTGDLEHPCFKHFDAHPIIH